MQAVPYILGKPYTPGDCRLEREGIEMPHCHPVKEFVKGWHFPGSDFIDVQFGDHLSFLGRSCQNFIDAVF
jgi:hypothetical protein